MDPFCYRMLSGGKLQDARENKHVNMEELSHASGISIHVLSLYEDEEIQKITLRSLRRLARALGKMPEDLCECDMGEDMDEVMERC